MSVGGWLLFVGGVVMLSVLLTLVMAPRIARRLQQQSRDIDTAGFPDSIDLDSGEDLPDLPVILPADTPRGEVQALLLRLAFHHGSGIGASQKNDGAWLISEVTPSELQTEDRPEDRPEEDRQ